VIKGAGRVVFTDKELGLAEGDLVLIRTDEKYFWDGNMTVFLPATPAWYPEQHFNVD
jgi:mannose-6-phosphate isomerase-like protein (cupin superfamily)